MAPSKNGKITANGKFAPGNNIGKNGRPQGSRNKATLAIEKLLEGEAEALTRKAIELAKDGDMQALRLCMERLCPPRRDSPVSVPLPKVENTAADTAKAMASVLEAVAEGDITPSEGTAIAGIIEHHRRAIETTEIEERLRKLEDQKP
jgi:hypothetical protein